MRPLDGITVVSLEHAIAAPFATRQLADLGARVIKIERPGVGDFARGYDETVYGQASHFVWTNRSKESLTLDLKHPEVQHIMAKLLETADVFVQNLAPGAVERLGLGEKDLTERYPRLVICNISGYGNSGPYRDKKAYDLLIQSEAGLVSVTGTPATPSKAGISIADIAAGMNAFSGILSALYLREKTGVGGSVEVSLLESLGEWMGYPLYYSHYGGSSPKRNGAMHAAIFPYGSFRTGDGKDVMLGLQNEREWEKFCNQVLLSPRLKDDPRFDSNPRRVANMEKLTAIIHAAFEDLDSGQVVERLENAGIANARINDMEEVWNHPQFAARQRWRDVPTPAGLIQALLPPATFSAFEMRMDAVPGLGEQSASILSEIGYSAKDIASLQADNAI
ncbi:CaiB/BaiF CoA-transferase family protein [uncultured Desulfuromusa sp.]|uniref:CaiB/BaiF CoA transferase family protein n=1 Tax=uncultured Desulfuromusa sp. TaxID=219183 RepID=UPI002AA8D110|nr:CaiB/BaiF CoA-transferase family protein [uncultured Desulfuromusa sp.]